MITLQIKERKKERQGISLISCRSMYEPEKREGEELFKTDTLFSQTQGTLETHKDKHQITIKSGHRGREAGN